MSSQQEENNERNWDTIILDPPPGLRVLEEATDAIGFTMKSDPLTLNLLRTLATIKPGGHFLELGTGTGISASWIRDGMDARSHLITIDHNEQFVAVARAFLGNDPRIRCVLGDGKRFIQSMREQGKTFDFIFADMEVGKYYALDDTLNLLAVGGIYVIDHLLVQPSWDEEHIARVSRLISMLKHHQNVRLTQMNWSTGILMAAKVG